MRAVAESHLCRYVVGRQVGHPHQVLTANQRPDRRYEQALVLIREVGQNCRNRDPVGTETPGLPVLAQGREHGTHRRPGELVALAGLGRDRIEHWFNVRDGVDVQDALVLLNKCAASWRGREVPVVLAIVNVEVALVAQLLQERVVHGGRVAERVVLQPRATRGADVQNGFTRAGVGMLVSVSLDESAKNN